jgi:glycosyltransferase involved in cell wall biosynthesis
MIDIVDLITVLSVGGTQRALTTLVGGSNGNIASRRVYSMMDVGPVGEELISTGIDVQALEMRRGSPSLFALSGLVRSLRSARPDVLECWTYHANLLGLVAGKLAGVPHIIWNIRCSNIEFGQYRRLTQWTVSLGARFSAFVDAIIFNSVAGKTVHQAWGYHNAKMMVIPNGINLAEFKPDRSARSSVRQELALSGDSLLIGLIARYHPMKDHAGFLNAAALLCRREPFIHLLLAGEDVGPDNSELSRLVYEKGLQGRVQLLGRRRDIPRLTAALDIATSSSVSGEGFSNAVGEAMACGVPCVATDVGDAADIVGDTGVVVPPGNAGALARGLAEIIDLGPHGRKTLGQRARQRVEEKFSIPTMIEAYKSLYQDIVDGSRPQTGHSVASY